MELRHLRYFIAVAEEGSFSNAAERRLRTAQPSLSRQIRDLELDVGVKLLERKARGIALTAAGRVFLDYARLVLLQVEAAGEAARRAERPARPGFVVGFLSGQEVVWLTETLRVLREEAPDTEIMVASRSSPDLADALMQGGVDVAFLRRERQTSGVAFKNHIRLSFGNGFKAKLRAVIRGALRRSGSRSAPVLRSSWRRGLRERVRRSRHGRAGRLAMASLHRTDRRCWDGSRPSPI